MNYQKIKNNLKQVYDELAPNWGDEKDSWGLKNLKELARLVKKNKGDEVLDLGCGSGVQSKQLSEEGLKITGLDLSPKMISEAKKRVHNGAFVVGDMTNMPFEPESFHGVYARASLLHIPKNLVSKTLKSIYRILKNKGYLYIAVKKGEGERKVREVKYNKEVERFFSFFEEKEITDLLKKTGFEIISVGIYMRKGGSTVWIEIVARKT